MLYDNEVKLLICKNFINTFSHTCAQLNFKNAVLKFVPTLVSSFSGIKKLCHFVTEMKAGRLIFLNNCKYHREELRGLFLRLFSFLFFSHFIWVKIITLIFFFFSVLGSSTGFPVKAVILWSFSHTLCNSTALVYPLFPQLLSSVHPLIYHMIFWWKRFEAHLECSLIRFPDPVLYTEKTDTEYHIFLGLICQQMY